MYMTYQYEVKKTNKLNSKRVNSQQGKTSGLLEYIGKLYPIFNKLDVNDPCSSL